MHEGIPLELNPVLKLLEMRKGCWRGICTTCLVSIWNEQKNRWDPFFNHDDDNNDHAQIHSRRIESCAQAAGNAQGPYAQLVWHSLRIKSRAHAAGNAQGLLVGNMHNLCGLSLE